jgi:hypothetical protein
MTTPISNATLSGAIKTVLEQAGLGLQVFRSLAPPKAHMPYCVVTEDVAWNAGHNGDTDLNPETLVREQAQVDIYQQLRGSDGTRTENVYLEDTVCHILHRTRLPTWVHPVYGVRILTRSTGVGDASTNVRRTIVTLEIDRLFEARTPP